MLNKDNNHENLLYCVYYHYSSFGRGILQNADADEIIMGQETGRLNPSPSNKRGNMRFISFSLMIILFIKGLTCLCCAYERGAHKFGRMEEKSGLTPLFTDNADCIKIASPYGSSTRYDGSQRPDFRFNGRHGGIDLSLPEGTPLLALANGTIVAKGEGWQMEGIYLWMRHSPDDTGLPYWIYSKYQHLNSIPELQVGARVNVGQVVAHSGSTGTTGGHYGMEGYPHLHFSIMKTLSGKYKIAGSRIIAPDATLMDPLFIYQSPRHKNTSSGNHTNETKTIAVPYISTDGTIVPEGARIIWPVACH